MIIYVYGGLCMNIISSKEFIEDYDNVLRKCQETGKPIYISNDGQNELVVMDVASFEKHEEELRAQQLVLEAYVNRLKGAEVYTIEEVKEKINKLL